MNSRDHWNQIYSTKASDQVSWYSPQLSVSLDLIEHASIPQSAYIIDVGGGESTLVDDLLASGYMNLTVLDISQTAIDACKHRLGTDGERVHWIAADITLVEFGESQFDLWHDRAVFHFLTTQEGRTAYVRQLTQAVKVGGHVIIGTFGPEGPTRCSGLDVVRYDAESLHNEFGGRFRLVESSEKLHYTPSGAVQQFLYCHFRLE